MKSTKLFAAALLAAALLGGCASNDVGMEKGEKKAGCCADGAATADKTCSTEGKAAGQCCESEAKKTTEQKAPQQN